VKRIVEMVNQSAGTVKVLGISSGQIGEIIGVLLGLVMPDRGMIVKRGLTFQRFLSIFRP